MNHKQAIDKLKKEQQDTLELFIAESGRRIVDKTPTDTGRAKAHWYVGSPGEGHNVTNEVDPSGLSTKSKIAAAAKRVKAGSTISIKNDLDYIGFIEFGSETIQPHAMVRSVANEAESILKEAHRKVSK